MRTPRGTLAGPPRDRCRLLLQEFQYECITNNTTSAFTNVRDDTTIAIVTVVKIATCFKLNVNNTFIKPLTTVELQFEKLLFVKPTYHTVPVSCKNYTAGHFVIINMVVSIFFITRLHFPQCTLLVS